jgi:hypothetical protein
MIFIMINNTVISRYNHFGYSDKCVIMTKMCSHNIGPYVNVWQLVSHLVLKIIITLINTHFFLINKAFLLCEFISKVNK